MWAETETRVGVGRGLERVGTKTGTGALRKLGMIGGVSGKLCSSHVPGLPVNREYDLFFLVFTLLDTCIRRTGGCYFEVCGPDNRGRLGYEGRRVGHRGSSDQLRDWNRKYDPYPLLVCVPFGTYTQRKEDTVYRSAV